MSARAPRIIRLVLAIALCLQSGLAFAHCLRLASRGDTQGGLGIPICTAEGVRMLEFSAEPDAPAPDEHAPVLVFCPACHGIEQAVLVAPPGVPAPIAAPIVVDPPLRAALPPLGARAPPYDPTGPPTLS